jgi:hypothetical protein
MPRRTQVAGVRLGRKKAATPLGRWYRLVMRYFLFS